MASRQLPVDSSEAASISAPDGLRSIGFADLRLSWAGPEHQEEIVYCLDSVTQKPQTWTDLSHLVNWSTKFLDVLETNKTNLAVLELIKGANEYPISLAKFHVDESISVVSSALSFEIGLNLQHPDTRAQNYAVNSILIDDSISLTDIVRQVFTCLFSKCVVRLVVKTNQFYSSTMSAYLVDLMHQSGASKSEIDCVAFDRRESIGNERFAKSISPNKSSKLSIMATVFSQTDTFAAAQGIIESYYREQYPNLIVLVEEAAYDRFVKDWQRYYSHAIHIGSRLDSRTTVTDTFNGKVKIDLAAIDIKASHKMSGNVINVLRFRTLSELLSLLASVRKVPHVSIWNDDTLLAREFCLRINQSDHFWLNHIPKSLAGRRLAEDQMRYYSETVAEDMTTIYNSIYSQFADESEQLRKLQTTFLKKDGRLRTRLILQAYTTLITKSKSLKNGATVAESVARLKRFQQSNLQKFIGLESESRIEAVARPIGLAMLLVREENSIKSKSVIVECIFKNLLLGNAVLLACPANTLGAKFYIDNDHVIPFKMVQESIPDISRLSLDESINLSEASIAKKQCPKNTYAFEILPEMTSEACEAITIALGTRYKNIWYPNVEQGRYWSDD